MEQNHKRTCCSAMLLQHFAPEQVVIKQLIQHSRNYRRLRCLQWPVDPFDVIYRYTLLQPAIGWWALECCFALETSLPGYTRWQVFKHGRHHKNHQVVIHLDSFFRLLLSFPASQSWKIGWLNLEGWVEINWEISISKAQKNGILWVNNRDKYIVW